MVFHSYSLRTMFLQNTRIRGDFLVMMGLPGCSFIIKDLQPVLHFVHLQCMYILLVPNIYFDYAMKCANKLLFILNILVINYTKNSKCV